MITADEFVESVAFPLGFVFSPESLVWEPARYTRPFKDLSLSAHSNTRVARCLAGAAEVVILGYAVHQDHSEHLEAAIAETLCRALQLGDEEFFSELASIVGRFAVLFRRGAYWRIVADAVGLRPVYYAVQNGQTYASSHAFITAQQITPKERYPPLKTQWGYPGALTPYPGVFILTPNHFLDCCKGSTSRFYPRGNIEPCRFEDAADLCIRAGRNVLAAALARSPVAVSISAGVDSRVTLGLAVHRKRDLRFFTYLMAPIHKVDVAGAEAFAAAFGLTHVTLGPEWQAKGPLRGPDFWENLERQLGLNSFGLHGPALIPRYFHAFGQWQHTHIRSNVYEIGRASFQEKKGHLKPPDTPERMVQYYLNWNVFKTDVEFVSNAFEDYFHRAESADALRYIDAHDLYFWEHRMPNWQSNVILESDCVWETLILLNSRRILDRLIAVPVRDRLQNRVFHEVLRRTEPRLLDYPINPKEWPATA